MGSVTLGAIIFLVNWTALPSAAADDQQVQQNATLEYVGGASRIPHQSGTHDIFAEWVFGQGTPITCRIVAQPDTTFQVFIGLSEAHWNEPGKRLVDSAIQGLHVGTVDTFEAGKTAAFGRIFPRQKQCQWRDLHSHRTCRTGTG